MRIRRFSRTIIKHLQKHNLKNCSVVIDGHNYFHNLYKDSQIPLVWGPECNKYANYLRIQLQKFKEANIKCYFVFKGGNVDINEEEICLEHRDGNIYIEPIFTKPTYKQVLDELGFDYVMCKTEAKTECIALAQTLSCPIISFDIEFCFSGVDYIPYRYKGSVLLAYNKHSRSLECKIFRLNNFLTTCPISKEMLSIFIVLTDEKGKLNIDNFSNFFDDIQIPFMHFSRNELLLSWLSNKTFNGAIQEIFKHLSLDNQDIFFNTQKSILKAMGNKIAPGIPSQYFINKRALKITEMDPLWFEKGIALRHIPRILIDIYNFKVAQFPLNSNRKRCHPENNTDSKISFYICLEIAKYSFDLLTDFCGASICFKFLKCCKIHGNKDIVINNSITKPYYFAQTCVFENGWDNIKQLKLFHHFLLNTLPGFNFSILNKAPESAQLLIISLVYYKCKKLNSNIDIEASSIMMSYIMLKFISPPKGKVTLIPDKECAVARSVLSKYFFGIKESQLLEGLCFCFYEFQECLEQLNNLNILCGKPLVQTIYSETYNATFVYNCTTKNLTRLKLKEILFEAPTVLELYFDLMEIYDEILNNISPTQMDRKYTVDIERRVSE